ncbi:MAG TPA: cytochrome P450 [Solirubrobacteraceae bacterium]|jgi:cytochrome P450|nr:cytochrome P450 [Solirubrobacteraceae bacterium]
MASPDDRTIAAAADRPGLDDLFPPEMRADPYPVYRQLRENAPVFDTGRDLWLVTSYEHCHALLRDERCSKNPRNMDDYERIMRMTGRTERIRTLLEQLMSFSDPPHHTRLRGLVQRAFTPRMIEGLRARAERVANELLEAAGAGDGEIELIDQFASRFPLAVIAEMLGVPASDRERFTRWSRDLAPTFELALPPGAAEPAERAAEEFIDYFRQLMEVRAKEPRDDLVSGLVHAEDEGRRLEAQELVVNLILILGAGHHTAMHMIGNGVLALVRHPDQLALLRNLPMDDAIEELLRYESPVQLTTRFPTDDIAIGGQTIPAGTRLAIILAAGNRDPDRFPDPDRLDLTRGDRAHLAFGGGIHYCLGNALARMEAGIAFRALLDRFPRIELATEAPEYDATILLRGLKALPLAVI